MTIVVTLNRHVDAVIFVYRPVQTIPVSVLPDQGKTHADGHHGHGNEAGQPTHPKAQPFEQNGLENDVQYRLKEDQGRLTRRFEGIPCY